MSKYLLILLAGIVIGYAYGFKDAKKNQKSVITRVVERVGGANRGKYNQNVDQRAEGVNR